MKKILHLCLISSLISLTACGQNKNKTDNVSTQLYWTPKTGQLNKVEFIDSKS